MHLAARDAERIMSFVTDLPCGQQTGAGELTVDKTASSVCPFQRILGHDDTAQSTEPSVDSNPTPSHFTYQQG